MTLCEEYLSIDNVGKVMPWLEPLMFDAACLHATCLVISTYYDTAYTRSRSSKKQRTAVIQHSRALQKLRERLDRDDKEELLSTSTMMTVMHLATHAQVSGDLVSANHHLGGLSRLVDLQGMDYFLKRPLLLIMVIRYALTFVQARDELIRNRLDLGLAVDSHSRPIFFTKGDIPWKLGSASDTILPHLRTISSNEPQITTQSFLDMLNPELAVIFTELFYFCSLLNAAVAKGDRVITAEDVLFSMTSIMYPLLNLKFEIGGLDETIRLGLVGFCRPLYLEWRNIKMNDSALANVFRQSLDDLLSSKCGADVPPRALMWLLMISGVSIFHVADDMERVHALLRPILRLYSISTWDKMQEELTSFLWTCMVFDRTGRAFFESVIIGDP